MFRVRKKVPVLQALKYDLDKIEEIYKIPYVKDVVLYDDGGALIEQQYEDGCWGQTGVGPGMILVIHNDGRLSTHWPEDFFNMYEQEKDDD